MKRFIFLVLCCLTLVLPISLSVLACGLMFQAFIYGNFELAIAAIVISCGVPFSCYMIIDSMFAEEKKAYSNRVIQ